MSKFEEQIDRFANVAKENLLNVARISIRSVVDEAQTPRGEKGGKLPVDTGFLRWSGVPSLNLIPVGLGRGRKAKAKEGIIYRGNQGQSLDVVLQKMKIGDTFFWGWTAKYARIQEARCGFLAAAIQNFSVHIANAVKELKR